MRKTATTIHSVYIIDLTSKIMKEELLHHIWKTKRFDHNDLKTTDGNSLSILSFGIHNHNAGPDFLNAKVRINDTEWYGNIELHIKSSDWNAHKHFNDPAYNNVILHVVYHHNGIVQNHKNQPIPTLELKDRIEDKHLKNYKNLIQGLDWVPCARHLPDAELPRINFFKERMMVQRLLRKKNDITQLLDSTNNDWEGVLYSLLLRYFGLKINGEAFSQLAKLTPYKTFKKLNQNIKQREAALLGQAGFLSGKDEYIQNLSQEYKLIKAKYGLVPMTGVEWKFSRLRPANFPTIRIAQIAALYHTHPSLFTIIRENLEVGKINQILSAEASSYWEDHYTPDKLSSSKKKKTIGEATKNMIIINVIAPLFFCYADMHADEMLKEKAIDLLSKLPPEKNKIITAWKKHDIKASSAADSQALLQLKNNYCDQFKCLDCYIGQTIIFQ